MNFRRIALFWLASFLTWQVFPVHGGSIFGLPFFGTGAALASLGAFGFAVGLKAFRGTPGDSCVSVVGVGVAIALLLELALGEWLVSGTASRHLLVAVSAFGFSLLAALLLSSTIWPLSLLRGVWRTRRYGADSPAKPGRARYLLAALIMVTGPVVTFLAVWINMFVANTGGMHREEVPWVGLHVLLVFGLPATIIGVIVGVVMAARTFHRRRNAPTA